MATRYKSSHFIPVLSQANYDCRKRALSASPYPDLDLNYSLTSSGVPSKKGPNFALKMLGTNTLILLKYLLEAKNDWADQDPIL